MIRLLQDWRVRVLALVVHLAVGVAICLGLRISVLWAPAFLPLTALVGFIVTLGDDM